MQILAETASTTDYQTFNGQEARLARFKLGSQLATILPTDQENPSIVSLHGNTHEQLAANIHSLASLEADHPALHNQ